MGACFRVCISTRRFSFSSPYNEGNHRPDQRCPIDTSAIRRRYIFNPGIIDPGRRSMHRLLAFFDPLFGLMAQNRSN
jgi:hypothetical protein